jgi:hypothetical protein
MSIRKDIAGMLGKTISGVLVNETQRAPETQVFLVFSDETHIELWGSINASGVDRRGGFEVAGHYARQFPGKMTRYGG